MSYGPPAGDWLFFLAFVGLAGWVLIEGMIWVVSVFIKGLGVG